MLEITEFAIRLAVVAQGRSSCLDRFGKDRTNERDKRRGAGSRDAAGLAARVDAGAVQHLADVDISEARDDMLRGTHSPSRPGWLFEAITSGRHV